MNFGFHSKVSPLPFTYSLFVGVLLFVASLIGVLSRPDDTSMTIVWPANAIFIALILRYPHRAGFSVWLAAIVGYMLADYICGIPLFLASFLTLSALSGVVAAWWLYTRVFRFKSYSPSQLSILHLVILCVFSSGVSAIFSALVMMLVLDRPYLLSMVYVFSGELSCMIAVLPVALTFPERFGKITWKRDIHEMLPLMMLVLSVVMIFILGGPGAITFPVLALVWCALSYSLFSNAVIAMLLIIFLFSCEVFGLLPLFTEESFISDTISFRLGVTMLVLAPLSVASINEARNRLIRELDHAVNYDYLTNVLSREAFEKKVEALLEVAEPKQQIALFMMDLDYFKQINDQYGHQGGDELLIHFARLVSEIMPKECVWGRMGGEEFAALVPESSCERSFAIAEHIRKEVSYMSVAWKDDQQIKTTVSIGVACICSGDMSWDELFSIADKALYQAKSKGRNRVCLHSNPESV